MPTSPGRRASIFVRAPERGTRLQLHRYLSDNQKQGQERAMRAVALWLIGIPIPIIILLYLFNVF